jgi:hypothetical protein
MRKAEEIKAEAEALVLPDEEHKALMLILEVFLDVRDMLDQVDSMAIHIEGHAERLSNKLCNKLL